MDSEKQKTPTEQLENLLIENIVVLRDQMLRSCKGRPPMNYWEQITNAIRSSARQSAEAAEWITSCQKRLRVTSPSSSDCSVIRGLVSLCDEHGFHLEMMEFVEREAGFLIASAREIVDMRKEARAAGFSREELEKAAIDNGLMEEVAP